MHLRAVEHTTRSRPLYSKRKLPPSLTMRAVLHESVALPGKRDGGKQATMWLDPFFASSRAVVSN